MKHLLTPHITEKSYRTISEDGKSSSTYTFKVNTDLDKEMIKKLVEREYKVTVIAVTTINLPGKSRRFKGVKGRTSTSRKAMVRLKMGDKITAFDIEDSKKVEKE